MKLSANVSITTVHLKRIPPHMVDFYECICIANHPFAGNSNDLLCILKHSTCPWVSGTPHLCTRLSTAGKTQVKQCKYICGYTISWRRPRYERNSTVESKGIMWKLVKH